MRAGHDKTALLEELEEILAHMAELSDSGDPIALSSVDLDFHRAVASHSGNELAAQVWEGLAQHLIIVFCRDWSNASDRPGEVRLHRKMIDFLALGRVDDIDAVLADHFSGARPCARRTKEPRRSVIESVQEAGGSSRGAPRWSPAPRAASAKRSPVELAARGAAVAIADRDGDLAMLGRSGDLPPTARLLRLRIRISRRGKPSPTLAAAVGARWGRLDIVVNNAAILDATPLSAPHARPFRGGAGHQPGRRALGHAGAAAAASALWLRADRQYRLDPRRARRRRQRRLRDG